LCGGLAELGKTVPSYRMALECEIDTWKAFRKAFDNFDPKKVANYNAENVKCLLENPRIVRNKAKILAAINNARLFLELQKEFGSFDTFIWKFALIPGRNNSLSSYIDVPSESEASKAMSKELAKRGFHFAGPTICYAFMQATGMVNDHGTRCFRYDEIRKMQLK